MISTEKGTKKLESYNVCFYIDALDPNTQITNYIDDVINDEGGKGSSRVSVKFYYDTLLEVFNEYKKVYDRKRLHSSYSSICRPSPCNNCNSSRSRSSYYMAETDTVGGRTINQGTYVK